MADDKVLVKYELDEKDYIDGLKSIQKESDKTKNEIVTDNKDTSKSWKDTGLAAKVGIGIAVAALTGVVIKLKEAADKTADYVRSMRGLNEVANAFGQDGGEAQKVAKGIEKMSSGMVSATQAAQGLKFLLSSGYSLSQASDMSQALLNVGAFNNVVGDLGQAFVDSAKGIKTGSIELIENIGLTEKLSSVMKRAGVDTTTGIDITNNAAQAQALYNSVMAQGEIFSGNLAEATKGYDSAMAEANLTMDKIIMKLGEKVQPLFISVAKSFTDFFKPFIEDMPTASEKLAPLISRMEELQLKTNPTVEEQKELRDIMNDISVLSPIMVTSYDNQGNAIINVGKATEELLKIKALELEADKKKLEFANMNDEEQLTTIQKNLDLSEKQREAEIRSLEQEGVSGDLLISNIMRLNAENAKRNRELIAEKGTLQATVDLRKAQIQVINDTQTALKNTSGIKEYKTAIEEAAAAEAQLFGTTDKSKGTATTPKLETPEEKTERILVNIRTQQDAEIEAIKFGNRMKLQAEENYIEEKKELVKEDESIGFTDLQKRMDESFSTYTDAKAKELEKTREIAEKELEQEEEFNLKKLRQKVKLYDDLDNLSKENTEKELENDAYYQSVKKQQDAKEAAASSARMGLKKAESQLVDDLINGQMKSLGDYGKIIADQVEMTLTGIAVESGIQSIFNLAKGLAFSAVGKVDSAAAAYSASATFAATAAAAGLGAVAANSIGSGMGGETETPTGEDETNTAIVAGETIDNKETVYISEADYQRMSFGLVDSVNDAMMKGKRLARAK